MSSLTRRSRNRSRVALTFAAATAASLLARLPASADGNVATYIDVAGNWADPGVWDTFTPPADGDVANIFGSGAGPAVLTYNNVSPATGNLAAVTIDGIGGTPVLLKQTGNSFATNIEYVGYASTGSLSIANGIHSVGFGPVGNGPLYIGFNAGSSGDVTLNSGGTLAVGGTTYVGYGGAGTFNHTGGYHSAAGLVVGSASTASGVYTMTGSDATLYVGGSETIGDAGFGSFTQSAGTLYTGSLTLGNGSSGNGSYSLSGGAASLTVYGTETVGNAGLGSFAQTAGVHQAGSLVVGQANSGTFTLAGTSTLTVNGSETIGSGGAGSFTQSGGSHSAGSLTVGSAAAGSYSLSGANSSLSVLGGAIVGDSAAGTFTQSAGSHTAAWLALGNSPGGNGSYTLSGGSASFNDVGVGGNPYYNGGGVGSLVVNGTGALKIAGSLTSYAGGTITLAGGSLTANSIFTDPTSGPIRWTAGALTVTSTSPFTIGAGGPIGSAVSIDPSKTLTVGGTLVVIPGGSLGLSGGTVTAGAIDLSAVGPTAFNWTTGTLNLTGTAGATVDPTGSLSTPFNLAAGQTLNIAGRLTVGATGVASFNQSGGQHSVGSLDLGASPGAFGTYTMGGASLTVATKAYVGDRGQGVLNLNGGNVAVNNGANDVYVGYAAGASGTMNIGGGASLTSNDVYVGFGGAGVVNQTSGNHILNGFLVLGGQPDGTGATATGTYNQSGGQLNANVFYVGLSGTGSFNQTGGHSNFGQITAGYYQGASGTVTISGSADVFEAGPEIYGDNGTGTYIQTGGSQFNAGVTLGNGVTGVGTAYFSGGVMNMSGITFVGNNGHGSFYQTGGTHAPSNLYMGLAATGVGYYSLSTGATLHAVSDFSGGNQFNGSEYLAYYGNATFDQTGGTQTIDNYLALAYAPGSTATYNLSGGTLSANAESVGYNSASNNTFNQTGGANSVRGYLTVGDQPNGHGTYNLSGSGSTLSATSLYDSWAGQGTVNQSGGVANVGSLFLAYQPGANSSYNLSGGTLIVTAGEVIAVGGRGTFTQTGGTHAVATTATMTIGQQGGVGTYNLQAGLLATGPVVNNGALNLAGGTATLGALSGAGTTVLSGTGAGGPMQASVTSFAQSSVTVGNNATLSVLNNTATPASNSATSLSITGTGTLDLANSRLLVGTTDGIRTSITRAAGPVNASTNLNTWTGTGLTSSVVQADAAKGNAKQLALGYFDSRDNGNTGLNVPAGQTLVRTTVYGDATGDGKVSIADLSVWNNNFGASNPRWSQGDFNYDGKVNIADLSIWNNDFGNNVNNTGVGPTVVMASARAASASVSASNEPATLTSAASPAVSTGTVEMDVNTTTGDVTLVSGGITIAALEVDSNAGNLISANWTSMKGQKGLVQWSNPRGTPNANEIAEFVSDPTTASGQPATLAAGTVIDYGNILPAGFADGSDLTFTYNQVLDTVAGTTASRTGNIVFVNGVPEPASLGLIGVAAAALLGRRRRR